MGNVQTPSLSAAVQMIDAVLGKLQIAEQLLAGIASEPQKMNHPLSCAALVAVPKVGRKHGDLALLQDIAALADPEVPAPPDAVEDLPDRESCRPVHHLLHMVKPQHPKDKRYARILLFCDPDCIIHLYMSPLSLFL